MLHHFDHRFGDYADRREGSQDTQLPDVPLERFQDPSYTPLPRYWLTERELTVRLRDRWGRGWLLGWRDICRSTDERTIIPCLLPRVGVGHTTRLLFIHHPPRFVAAMYASLCSFVVDYTARQKVGGTHLTFGQLRQLPVLPPVAYSRDAPWAHHISLSDWLLPRVLELTYTAWDLESFGRDVGYEGPPFRWDVARRFLLRCELDAAFFHLYGLSREDTDYAMDTFPIVCKNDEKAHGEYRTKRVILKIYDAMAEAARTGTAYQTRLDPAPANPRVAHADTRPYTEKKGER